DAKADIETITQEERQQQNVQVSVGDEGITIRIRDRAAFDSGRSQLKEDFKSLLSRIGQVINRMTNQVVIEGHTDNVPINTGQFSNNHWLSSARALTVLDYFADQVGIARGRMSAIGYGEYRPVDPEADQDDPAVRSQNRRVEIRILYNKQAADEAPADSVRQLINEFGLGVSEPPQQPESEGR
ncbi:MAG: OmpA family protein, partial [Gemmatimonadota bacterium]